MSAIDMLYGGGLVAVGVLAHALAERIRDLRIPRVTAPREAPARSVRHSQPVAEPAAPKSPPRVPKPTVKASADGGDDVIAALVGAGYKRNLATEATWACGPAERASVETWIASALRRCARGGMS